MQYSTILLSVLAATGAMAAPTRRQTTSPIAVVLQSSVQGSTTNFDNEGVRQVKRPVGGPGPYDIVTLNLGANVQQGLRCQLLDEQDTPIVLIRGENIDITFADGDKGAWSFQNGETNVGAVICDPAFVAGGAPDTNEATGDQSIRVQLSDGNLATQTPFENAGLQAEVQNPVASSGPFNTVELSLGEDVQNQELRCQILDLAAQPITLKRGENIDVTFADGGKGPWTFINAAREPINSEVSKIICDPAFKKASA